MAFLSRSIEAAITIRSGSMWNRLFLGILALSLMACKSENKNPEMMDQIYLDILKDKQAHQALLDESLKKMEQLEKDLGKTEPNTMDRRMAIDSLRQEKEVQVRNLQMIEYYDLRAQRRKVYGRAAYKRAFYNGKDWPDPKEFSAYLTNKRLKNVSANWSDRVPKSAHVLGPSAGDSAKSESGGSSESPAAGP
jgi:hypothetical protein